jgi:hypothetical protein
MNETTKCREDDVTELAWNDAIEILNTDFPILSDTDDYPSISAALDDGLDDLLRDSIIGGLAANPHYVEDLLRDCVNRVANCLLLREKAQDVELRAIGEALNHKAQNASLKANEVIERALSAITPTMGQNATRAIISGEQVQFEGDSAPWQKVSQAQAGLLEQLKEGLAIQRAKSKTPGNGSKFVERFAFLKRLFDINMVGAYRRALVCAKALKEVYGISAEVPRVTPNGYLNELSVWAQQASDALDEALDRRLFSDIAFTVAGVDETLKEYELVKRTKFNTEIAAGRLTFTLAQSHFATAKMANPLLRSLRLQVRAKDESRVRIWPAQVVLPKSRVTDAVEIFPCVAPSLFQDTPSQDAVVRGVHNISPIGEWEIRISDRAITSDATNATEITNVYLFLRLSYQRV